ncbi:MAG: amino acid adenylation domain-containing protein [Methylococcaceae bacterium]
MNTTQTDYPKHSSIHYLFELQVEKTPDAVAVKFKEQQLSYKELNSLANQLAHFLRDIGIKPGSRVGVFAERGINIIVGMLAILKADAAYVPLDPSYPIDRLQYMLVDSGPLAVLSETNDLEITNLANIENISLEGSQAAWRKYPEHNLNRLEDGQNADAVAYIIYTSGSTGRPKGVMVGHRSIVNLVINNGRVNISPEDRVAYTANTSFDPSTFQIWASLLNGAAIIVIEKPTLLDAEQLGQFIQRNSISVLDLPVVLFNRHAEILGKYLTGLNYLVFGGDKLNPKIINNILAKNPPKHLFNLYGPTEATVFSTAYEITQINHEVNNIPIGQPIANTQIYILDADYQPVTTGEIGEIYIGGDGLALGYLNQPDLTQERFINNPFFTSPQNKIYKTGDLGRQLEDGNIEFLGRNDHQVKIRGYRIELGEIEFALTHYDPVHEAVVIALEDGGYPSLVAYYTSDTIVGAETLRKFLIGKLPGFMIPAAYVHLVKMPLTANNKLDRQALPTPSLNDYYMRDYVAPIDDTEAKLAKIWATQLKVKRVGRYDNFFDLGGHSLLAASLLAEIEKVFNTPLPLVTMFNFSTLAEMAGFLRTQSQEVPWFSIFPVQKEGTRPPLFWLEYGTKGNFEVVKQLGKHQPVLGLRYGVGAPIGSKLEILPTIESWATEYVKEIRLYQPNGPYFLIGHCLGGLLAYEVAQQLAKQNLHVGHVFLVDPYIPNISVRTRLPFREQINNIINISAKELSKKLSDTLRNFKNKISELVYGPKYRPESWESIPIQNKLSEYIASYYAWSTVTIFNPLKQTSLLHTEQTPDVEWHKLFGDKLSLYTVPGDHLTLMQEQGALKIAKTIEDTIKNTISAN